MRSCLEFGNQSFLLTANGGEGCLSSMTESMSTRVADLLDADEGIEVDSIRRSDGRSAIRFRYEMNVKTLLETVTDTIWESFRL